MASRDWKSDIMNIGGQKTATADAQPAKSAFAEKHPVAERTILLLRVAGDRMHQLMVDHAERARAAKQEIARREQEALEAEERRARIQRENEDLLDFYGLRGTASDPEFLRKRAREANGWLDVYADHMGCVDDAMMGRSPPRR